MNAAVGIILGLVLIVVALALFFVPQLQPFGVAWFWVSSLVTVVTGVIPVFLLLIGIFVVWLQADELKSKKEFEEVEPKKPTKKRRTKK